MKDCVIAGKQAMFFEDFFISVEQGARRAVRRGGCALNYRVEEFDGCVTVSDRKEFACMLVRIAYLRQKGHLCVNQACCIHCRSWGMAFELAT